MKCVATPLGGPYIILWNGVANKLVDHQIKFIFHLRPWAYCCHPLFRWMRRCSMTLSPPLVCCSSQRLCATLTQVSSYFGGRGWRDQQPMQKDRVFKRSAVLSNLRRTWHEEFWSRCIIIENLVLKRILLQAMIL